jgi:hypothetical protein
MRVPNVTLQQMIDAGINGFAIKLLEESFKRFADFETAAPFTFDFNGVRFTIVAATNAETLDPLEIALRESLKLQAHYAELLNMHDGGERTIFKTPDAWIKRLRDTGTIG